MTTYEWKNTSTVINSNLQTDIRQAKPKMRKHSTQTNATKEKLQTSVRQSSKVC